MLKNQLSPLSSIQQLLKEKPARFIALFLYVPLLFAIWDMLPLAVAQYKLSQWSAEKPPVALNADLDKFFVCHRYFSDKTSEQQWRTCVLNLKPETAPAALAVASSATIWLFDHPDDKEIRNAALAAIETGKAEVQIRDAYWDEVSEAQSRSLVLSLLKGSTKDEAPKRQVWTKILEQAKVDVLHPEMARARSLNPK